MSNWFNWQQICAIGMLTASWADFSLPTFPWLFPFSLTFPWPLSNSLTFQGFPDEWPPCIAHPLYGASGQWGLNPINLAKKPHWLDGQLKSTASIFNHLERLEQFWMQGLLIYTQNSPFLPSRGQNYCHYTLHLPKKGWPGWVGLDKYWDGLPATGGHQAEYKLGST